MLHVHEKIEYGVNLTMQEHQPESIILSYV